MAILGKIDRQVLTVTAEVQADANGDPRQVKILGGDITDPTDDNYIEPGDVLELNEVPSVVYAITDGETLQLRRDAVLGAGQPAARRTPPKEVADYVDAPGDTFVGNLLLLSLAEAQDPGSRARGLTGPGWWHYKTYVDAGGNTRHKAECIASFAISGGTAGVVGDDTLLDDATTLEETVAGQVDSIITLVQPIDAAGTEGDVGTVDFTVSGTTSTGGGVLFFQWQRKASGGRWVNISGETTDTLSLSEAVLTVSANNGDQYRVKVTDDAGAPEVVSDAATLTVNS